MTTSIVMTAIGEDRPGIVEALSEVGRRFGANWAGGRMASLAGQFAGMVHFEVEDAKVAEFEAALHAFEAQGLRVTIARGSGAARKEPVRILHAELVGHDRPGIVHDFSESLARLGVSIEELHTEVTSAAMADGSLFKVHARLAVPASVGDADVKGALESLANEMMVDLEAPNS